MRSFVNGVFDILHVGHLRLLQYASLYGELTVAINSDNYTVKSTATQKRPINADKHRAELLSGLSCVNRVLIFIEDNPVALLNHLYRIGKGPHVAVKGIEYKHKDFPEREIIQDNGTQLFFYDSTIQVSSTELLTAQNERDPGDTGRW